MISKIIKFFRTIKNLYKLGSAIEKVETDKNGNAVIVTKNNLLIAANGSLGFYTDKNLILESDLLSMNTLSEYNALNLQNTASLMQSNYDDIVAIEHNSEHYNFPIEYLYTHLIYTNQEMNKVIEKL